jgi:uncharacterized membrane protein YbhN (UPF0104 family)
MPAWLQTAIKAVLSSLVIGFVLDKLLQADYSLSSMAGVFAHYHWVYLVGAVLLLPFNLGLEAFKLHRLIRPLYGTLPFRQTLYAVLAGMSLGFITPNRLGEYAGRVLYLPQGHRTEAAVATYLGRLSQLVAALAGAAMGVAVLLAAGKVQGYMPLLWIALLAVLATALATFIAGPRSMHAVAHLLRLDRWRLTRAVVHAIAKAQASFPRGQLQLLLLLGMVRYGVFIAQYYLLLCAFGYSGTFALAAAVCALVFILKSLVPSVAFSEMGIREGIALQVMGWMFIPAAVCFNATLGLFALNLLLPSALGVLFLLRLQLAAPRVKGAA